MRKLTLIALAATALGLHTPKAHADVNLVMACTDANPTTKGTKTGGQLCVTRTWTRPTANTAVLSCSTANGCAWGQDDAKYRTWSSLPDSNLVLTCSKDIPKGTFTTTDPCGDTSAGKPWTQKKAVQATDTPEAGGTATLTWTPPTTNTDGTPLTDLAGYNLFQGTSTTTLTQVNTTPIDKAQTTTFIDNLPAGTWFWTLTAINAAGAESDRGNPASKTIVALSPPTVSFSGNPGTGIAPAQTTLTWGTTGATACTGSGGWSGAKAANGSEQITGIAVDTTFTITCAGPGGTATKDFTFKVAKIPNAPTNLTVQ